MLRDSGRPRQLTEHSISFFKSPLHPSIIFKLFATKRLVLSESSEDTIETTKPLEELSGYIGLRKTLRNHKRSHPGVNWVSHSIGARKIMR